MKFEEALILLREGKMIKRKGWSSCLVKGDYLHLHFNEMLANDWEEYKVRGVLVVRK